MPTYDDFLKDKVCLMEVENEIKFAHISEISVENLYEVVDNIQNNQLIVFFFDACCEIQWSISKSEKSEISI